MVATVRREMQISSFLVLTLILDREGNKVVTSVKGRIFGSGFSPCQPAEPGKSEAAISARSLGCKEFGEITKTNRVPSGALNSRWRRWAFAIANA